MIKWTLVLFHLVLLGSCRANPPGSFAFGLATFHTNTRVVLKKKEQGESTSQKILKEISCLKTKRKPGKSPKEQNERGGETGKPVL